MDRVENFDREEVFKAQPITVCRDCEEEDDVPMVEEELSMEEILRQAEAPELPHAERIMNECVNFIIDSMLQDVIKLGTGRRARVLERNDIAGKTGTTNGPTDAWFSGYNPDVVATAWLGFDSNADLGKNEFGGKAALPMWIELMREALKNSPDRSASPMCASIPPPGCWRGQARRTRSLRYSGWAPCPLIPSASASDQRREVSGVLLGQRQPSHA